MTNATVTQTSPLDKIFRRVDQIKERPGVAVVQIDVRTREIVDNKGLLNRILRSPTVIYELDLDTPVEIYDAVETMRIFGTQETATIGFRMTIVARAAHARDIVRVLASVRETPHERLMGIVRAAVKRAADRINAQSPDGLMANILAGREMWQEEMQRSIADQTGLEVRFIFNPPVGAKAVSRSFTVHNLEMRTRDAPHRVFPLTLTVTLEPNGQAVLDPLAPSDQIRIDRSRQILGRQLPPEICLYDLWFDLGRVEGALKATLSAGLRSTGFSVADLVLEPITAPIAREEQVRCPIVWTGRAGRLLDFNIEAVIRLKREETGRFDALHLPTRQVWLQKEAERVLRIAMHGRDFEDLNLIEQRVVEEHVVRQLQDAARATGQEIEPVVAKVLLPEGPWLEGRRVDIPTARYPTHNPLIDAEFAISLDVSLRILRGVIDRLRARADLRSAPPVDFNRPIEEEIVAIATEAARSTMTAVEANDYFRHFEPWIFPGDTSAPVKDVLYVEQRLIRAIDAALRQRLEIETLSVRVNRTDSEISKIHQEILALNPLDLTVANILTAASRGASDDMAINLRVRSDLPNADEIPHLLQRRGSRPFEKAKVLSDIAGAVQQFLRYRKSADIIGLGRGRIPPVDGRPSVFMELERHVADHIRLIYGFPVRIDHVDPVFSEKDLAERERADLTTAHERARTQTMREDIADSTRTLTDQRGRIDAQITALEAHLRACDIMDTERRKRLKDEIDALTAKRARIGRATLERIDGMPTLAALGGTPSPAEPTGAEDAKAEISPTPDDGDVIDGDVIDGTREGY